MSEAATTEIPSRLPLEVQIRNLQDPETARPIEIDYALSNEIGIALKSAGRNVEIEDEEIEALKASRFRDDLTEGRGVGMVAVLGETSAQELIDYCRELSDGGLRIVSEKTKEPIEGSEGRGLRQAAADLVLAVYDPEVATDRLNVRIWKWLVRNYRKDPTSLAKIEKSFESVSKPDDPKKVASADPSGVLRVWEFLTR